MSDWPSVFDHLEDIRLTLAERALDSFVSFLLVADPPPPPPTTTRHTDTSLLFART